MKEIKTGLFVVAVIVLTGCASSNVTHLPDGRQGYSLNCSGTLRTWGMCLEKAGELCGAKGYDIISRNGDSGEVISAQSEGGVFASTTISRNILVACGD